MSIRTRLAVSILLAVLPSSLASAGPAQGAAAPPDARAQPGDPSARRADPRVIDELASAWRAVHGPSWQLVPDRDSGYLAFFSGAAIAPSAAPRSDAEHVALARRVLADTEGLHGIPVATLVDDRTSFLPLGQIGASDKTAVRFLQAVDGVPVARASVNVLFDTGGALLAIESQALPEPEAVAGARVLDADLARARAAAEFARELGLAPTTVGAPALVILRERVADGVRGRLAWQVDLLWSADDSEPEGRLVSIDAVDGALVRSEPTIHALDVHGRVVVRASPGVLPDTPANPESTQPMKYVTVESALGHVRTNANGEFTFPGVGVPLEVTVRFRGRFNDVVNLGNQGEHVRTVTLPPNVPNVVVLNRDDQIQHTGAANAFQCVNRMRDWVRSVNPTDATADFVANASVNWLVVCNATYHSNSMMRFGRAAQGPCPNFSYSTVVGHEHGHWLNDRYGTGNGFDGIGEGNADVFAMYLWDDSRVALDWTGPGTVLRDGLNTQPFCGDCCSGCYGEPHADGEPWMGAAWKIRERLNATHGDAAGDLVADSLFLAWMNAFDQQTLTSNIQSQWVLLDDDDGNLLDGTPNFCEIQCGFRDQGFPGMSLPPFCCP